MSCSSTTPKRTKPPAVRPLIEQRGATLRYLPPYSPDFNPIEPAWRLVKPIFDTFKSQLLTAEGLTVAVFV
jgi:transposase